MRIAKALAFVLTASTIFISSSLPILCDILLRGVVVDRSEENTIWLGLPSPAARGMIFDVKLMPGGKTIAQAEVVETVPNPPYIAKARFKMLDAAGFVPIGSYVELASTLIPPDTDAKNMYKAVKFNGNHLNPLSFQAGVFFPTDSTIHDETSSVWPAFELLYRTSRSKCLDTNIGVGYYHRAGNFTTNGIAGHRDYRVLPFTFEGTFWAAHNTGYGPFARAGIGAYFIDDKRNISGVSNSKKVTTFGWQAGIGYETAKGMSAQIYYVSASRDDFRGLNFSLGARF